MDFDLWLETEHLEGATDDFCNIHVTVSNGEAYALNVWTFSFFEVARRQGEETASTAIADRYLLPPDLFVADLGRKTVASVVNDMLDRGTMPPDCRLTDDDLGATEGTAT
jgi:hypothetical protein